MPVEIPFGKCIAAKFCAFGSLFHLAFCSFGWALLLHLLAICLWFSCFYGERIFLIQGLEVSVNKVWKQAAKKVGEGHLTVVVVIQTPAERFDVVIRHHVPRAMRDQEASNLCFVNLALILGIHRLEQLSNLQITFTKLHTHNSGVKLLYLSLNLPFNLYFTFQKLRESTENIIGAALDILNVLASNFLQQPGRDLLVGMWNYEIYK